MHQDSGKKYYIICDSTKTKRRFTQKAYYTINDWGWVFNPDSATKLESREEAEFLLLILKKYGQKTKYSEIKDRQVPIEYEILEYYPPIEHPFCK